MYKLQTTQSDEYSACNFTQKVEVINSQVTSKMLREGVGSVIGYYCKVLTHSYALDSFTLQVICMYISVFRFAS